MKFLAVASFAALAVATPALEARDGWEAYTTTTTPWYDPATWVPYTTTTAKWVEPTTWAPYPTTTAKWVDPEWDPVWSTYKKADPTWEEWYKKPKYTTTVVTAITTYCPEPTTMVHAGKTYVVTKATTITITDCPCTISVPIYVKTSTSCSEKPAAATTWAAVPVVDTTKKVEATTWAAYDTSKSVMPTTTNVWSPIATYKGAADRVNVGAGLAGVVGIAALLL